jgi:hypothetical protein
MNEVGMVGAIGGQNPASIVDLDLHGQANEMEGGTRHSSGAMAGTAAYGLRGNQANRRGNSQGNNK